MPNTLIRFIKVKKLFGYYTYTLPQNDELSNASILYGDNGVGKSTILRLAFHLLSCANDRGHRTALYETDFENIEVGLWPDVLLSATSLTENEIKILRLQIHVDQKLAAIWDYLPERQGRLFSDEDDYIYEVVEGGRGIIRKKRNTGPKIDKSVARGNEGYISVLSKYAPVMYILNADRRLDSDQVSDPSDEVELRRMLHLEAPKRINELVAKSRQIALSQALGSASKWLGSKAVRGTNQGSMNVHSVYLDVLRHILGPTKTPTSDSEREPEKELVERLEFIESQTSKHAQYELATQLETSEFRAALLKAKKKSSDLVPELLKPYITSLERRLDAVEPTYQIIDRFVTTINSFLRDKAIFFKLSQGFKIRNILETNLESSQLSSGEQQLLLLFCYVLTARDKPSVFMIDEPEISLNVKWQRHLVQALLNVADGSNVQFIFASHSIELLAQHRQRVVKLINEI